MLYPNENLFPGRAALPITPEQESAVGGFIIAWGALEAELDLAFSVLFRIAPELASCIYAGMGTKAKLDILAAAALMLRGALGDPLHKRFVRLDQQTRGLSGHARNVLAHGQPEFGERTVKKWNIARYVAGKPGRVIYSSSPTAWARRTDEVNRANERWSRALEAAHRKLSRLTASEFREHCVSTARAAPPARQRRRKRPPQKRSGS